MHRSQSCDALRHPGELDELRFGALTHRASLLLLLTRAFRGWYQTAINRLFHCTKRLLELAPLTLERKFQKYGIAQCCATEGPYKSPQ